MAIKAIFFDLDGTLLPMDQERFVQAYLQGLADKMEPLGYEPKTLKMAVWAGTVAMVKNDGSRTNEEVFWDSFCAATGRNARADEDVIQDFYRNEFQNVRNVCGFAPEAAQVIDLVKQKGFRPVLATNPLFPRLATESRIRWAGMEPEDFVHYTTYENASFCKPNPAYYQQILDTLGLAPQECVMVGNDAAEDGAAEKLGMQVFYLTPCLINKQGRELSGKPQGGFGELMDFIRGL